MAPCFDDLIGIKSKCSTSTGSSTLFIEDTGITADEAGYYINSEYSSGLELIQDKIRFASDIVRKTIVNHFSDHIITKSVISSERLGFYQDNLNLQSGIVATYGGISLTLNNWQSYFNVYVNSISLQVNVTQDVNVFVYDLISGTLLDTVVVSTTANVISTTIVNKTYSSPKQKLDLIFVYDTEGISSNTTQIYNQGCMQCSGFNYYNYYIWSSGITVGESSSKIRSSLTSANHTSGLSVVYSVQCSVDNWLCEISNLMALPILYKTAEEVMNYACYYSNRQTSSINIDAERNKERLALYQSAYNDALQATIKKINIPRGDQCFKCEEYMRSEIILP